MEMKQVERCDKCKYWREKKLVEDEGFCFRFPPIPLVWNDKLETRFPVTGADDWCGEFQAKPSAVNWDDFFFDPRTGSKQNPMSIRAYKTVLRSECNSFDELLKMTREDLLAMKNVGVTTVNEIARRLAEFGLKLKGD